MKLKILPKAIIVGAIIGALGYAATFIKIPEKDKAQAVENVNRPPVVLTPDRVDITPAPVPQYQPAPMPSNDKVILPEVERARNAGLEKLLNSGNKK